MTSREKVRKLFRREPIDGIVIDFGGMSSDGISAIAYARLVRALGLPERPVRVYDIFQQTAAPDMDVVNIMGGDFVQAFKMRLRFGISCKEWKESVLADGSPCLIPYETDPEVNEKGDKTIYVNGVPFAKMPSGGFYYDQIAHPLAECEDIGDLDEYRPNAMREDEVEYIINEVNELYENTDKAIVFGFGGSLFEQAQRDFGFENCLCNLLVEEEMMCRYFRMTVDAYIEDLKKVLPHIQDKIEVVQFFDDLGTQIAPLISPDTYRELIKPYHAELYGFIHENFPRLKVLLHSCGAIYDIIPDLIEAGGDMLNPVQVSAAGMDPQLLKDSFGDKLFFWGGAADLQGFVQNTDDIDAIRAHVDELTRIFSKNGGFVFSQIHNFQHDTPAEKILAIYETAKKHKK